MTSTTINKVILIGICGKDPEILYVKPSGLPVCNFTIATHKNYKTEKGKNKEETTWHRLSAWQHIAEYIGENVKKGSKVYVEGEISNQSYTDMKGIRRNYMSILVSEIKLLNH